MIEIRYNDSILGTFWCLFLVSCKRTWYCYPALGRGLLFDREIGDYGGPHSFNLVSGVLDTDTRWARARMCVFSWAEGQSPGFEGSEGHSGCADDGDWVCRTMS